ncbi:MAG: polysaccharide deacetylase family protein [candidate division WOR-3 bacterium]
MNQILSDLLKTEGLLKPLPIENHLFDFDAHFPIKAKKGKIKFLFPQRKEIFSGVGIIDLEKKGFLFKEGVYEKEEEVKIILPFSLKESLLDTKVKPRFFYFHPRKFPYEFVSAVSKGEIKKLLFNALRQICLWQDIEYQHLWYYPKNFLSVFIFRLDTDFAREREIKITHQILREVGINATWFINSKEHKRLIPFFAHLKKEGEDIQLHCYAHNLFPDYQRNYFNIKKGKELLEEKGIEVKGFASPFGLFNQFLYEVLSDLGFSFSSEFGLSYDDLPFYPRIEDKKFPILQIPIHPMCVGRLLEAGFNEKTMITYYKNYIDWRYGNRLPIIIYDHPHRLAQFPNLFKELINYAKSKERIWLTTMARFYQWWKEREQGEGQIHIINREGEYLKDREKEEPIKRLSLYFPSNLSKIKGIRNGIIPNLRLKAKSMLWKVNRYLKGRTQ